MDDPLGLTINWANASTKPLIELLADHRPLVRDRAQNALILRGNGAVPVLASALDNSQASIDLRLRVVWTLASIADEASLSPLRKALQDSNANVVIAVARSLALRKDRHSAPALSQLLNAKNLHVRRAAAEALAHCGDAKSLASVWQALADDTDRFLEHSLIFAAYRLADEQGLNAALQHAHPRVQKAALLLLDQPPRPRSALGAETVFRRAASLDAELRRTALRILQKHAEWAAPASALVEGWMKRTAATAEEKLNGRNLILAFQSALSMQQIVGEALREGSIESRLFL
jgi:HEAT repeat protein